MVKYEGMSVELLDVAGSDKTIVNTARLSMGDNGSWYELEDGYDQQRAEKLIRYLAKHKHTSPFRHTMIAIKMKVPIFLARQLMKHQVGLSCNEVSRRYVSEGLSFWGPTHWRLSPQESVKQGSGGDMPKPLNYVAWEAYNEGIEKALSTYEEMLKINVAPEMARSVLPQSMNCDVIWTGSLLAFAHVYNLRAGEGAQQEAKEFATLLQAVIKPKFPASWEALTQWDD